VPVVLFNKLNFMKQKHLFITIVFFFICSIASAYVTISYYNKDSKAHKFKVNMDGNSKEVVFDASKTSAVTVQGSGKLCVIETPCGKVEIKDGMKIEIKDGCIKVL
jgi:hypothetical protein